jgi:hypothetical protein
MDTSKLDGLCGVFRRRLRLLMMQAGAGRVIAGALVLLPMFMFLDWWLHLGTLWRCLALLLYAGALGATAWWTLLRPLGRNWSNEEILSYIDSILPAKKAMLLELYQLIGGRDIQEASTDAGRQMVDEAAQELEPLISEAAAARHLYRRRAMNWLKCAGAALVILLVLAMPLSSYMAIGLERFFNPFSGQRWPHRTTITLKEPITGWTIPQLESFTVEGAVRGQVPPQVTLSYRGENTGYWIREKVAVRDDGRIKYVFPEVREKIRFFVAGGDYQTDQKTIGIVARPFLKSIQATYDYPDYAGIPDRSLAGGQLVGLEGTKVKLDFESSMALKDAVMVLSLAGDSSDSKKIETRQKFKLSDDGRHFSREMFLTVDGSYSIELYEINGFREAKPERYEIRVTPDNPPEVELLSPGRNLIATKKATLEVALRASDDFGLKTVEFLWSLDGKKEAPLTDRITGPLTPEGKSKRASFVWDLRKMKNLPASGLIRYSVRVKDVNPAPGRGISVTTPMEIKLVKPSQFHFDLFEAAKRIEAEGRLAWESQYAAWVLAGQWMQKGTGKEEDPLWLEMKDKQNLAIRAARAMETYLLELSEQYEKNGLQREFMAGRLGVIVELLRQVTTRQHPPIAQGLRRARPGSQAEAAAARLKVLRRKQVRKFIPNQKLATLYLERLVKRLFDWRDLQTTLIRTTMLHEEQDEVLTITTKLAPQALGQELEDLADELQDQLLTLGKRQRTLFDVESELEKELEFQIHRAEGQKRKSILLPLRAAYKGLRAKGVKNNLKIAARKIENNQAFQIIKNQKAALQVLSLVKGGLIQAGQKVEAQSPIVLAMTPSRVLDVKPAAIAEKPDDGSEQTAETGEVEALTPEELLANLPVGSDPVTVAINVAWEAQDAVRARTEYLNSNSKGQMPRYVRLKQGLLTEKQDLALRVLLLAVKESDNRKYKPVSQALQEIKISMLQSRELIGKRILGKLTYQMQSDTMDALDDLRRLYLPLQKTVAEAVEENVKRKGLDAFNRKFLLRAKDLEGAVAIISRLNQLQLLLRDAMRRVKRLAGYPGRKGLLAKFETINRARGATMLGAATVLLSEAGGLVGGLSDEVRPKVLEVGMAALAEVKAGALADRLKTGGQDKQLTEPATRAAALVGAALSGMRDLLSERVKPKVKEQTEEGSQTPVMSLEQWEKMRTPEYLRARLKENNNLPPEIRQIMLKALSRKFPKKYRNLLANYYASFVTAGGKKKDNSSDELEKKKELPK